MPDANAAVITHFLKDDLKSAPSHSLFPNPGLCLVTSTVNTAAAFVEINREMCGAMETDYNGTEKQQRRNKKKSSRPLYITRMWRRNKEILNEAVVERNG